MFCFAIVFRITFDYNIKWSKMPKMNSWLLFSVMCVFHVCLLLLTLCCVLSSSSTRMVDLKYQLTKTEFLTIQGDILNIDVTVYFEGFHGDCR